MKIRHITLLIIALALPGFAFGDQVQVDASLDTAYLDIFPENNLGAHTHVTVSVANNGIIFRSLFFMDIAAAIPAGSTINSVVFEFNVTQQGGFQGQQGELIELRRVTNAWTEGTGEGNLGSATGDGATWENRTGADLWTTPGGDFAVPSSGSVFVDHVADGGGTITYSLGNAQLATDVQDMLDNSGNNFGFALKAVGENLPGSAMRVTSRENINGGLGSEARLIIDFTLPNNDVTVCAGAGLLVEGTGEIGDFNAACGSDDSYWAAHGEVFAFQISDPVVQFELTATAPAGFGGGTISVDVEASKQSNNANLNLRALLFNFTTGSYVSLPGIMPLATADAVRNFTLPVGSDPVDFIEPGTDEVWLLLQTIQTTGLPNVRTQLDEVLFNFESLP